MKPNFLFFFFLIIFYGPLCAQSVDTTAKKIDSVTILSNKNLADSIKIEDSAKVSAMNRSGFKFKNKLLNTDAQPVSFVIKQKKARSDDAFFYLIAGLVLALGFLKYFYGRYFTNLFRVFFNTSLRQNQITDQLLQAKLPSFLFNIFFVVSAGIYVYAILLHYGLIKAYNNWLLLVSSIALMGLIYFIKYCTLKFTGWITGLTEEVNIYVFVIFLINKIIGILLVPFIILLAFSDIELVRIAALISLISIGIFLLLRFFQSYALIQNQLRISKFHFVLYITGLEIIPLMLIYKGLMFYLTKKL